MTIPDPSTLGCGSGTPGRWMYPDEGCDLAARSPPPRVGRICVRYISAPSRARFTAVQDDADLRAGVLDAEDLEGARRAREEEGRRVRRASAPQTTSVTPPVQVGWGYKQGGEAARTRLGWARHGRAKEEGAAQESDIPTCQPHGMAGTTRRFSSWEKRTDACAPFARLLPPVRLSGSGRLSVASTAPTQRPHALPSLYLLLVWTPRHPVVFTDTHAGRPLPSLRHLVRVCAGAFGSSSSPARARVTARATASAG
ncbi:hypothetical protein B0H10DRAFT_582770 [Mycena sp. CBHHK59/15]|nr:hypothetical protein B0H10DRAFT_582770 [Mycena sp. CBHHK59/15]